MWIFVKLPKPAAAGAGILALVFMIYPFIALFQYRDFCSHKDDVQIAETECLGFVWDDKNNSYANGADYANFKVDVEFGENPVQYFKADTLVYKDGKFLGYILGSFSPEDYPEHSRTSKEGALCFKTNYKATLHFNIHHVTGQPWDDDEIITELYKAHSNGTLDQYDFVTKVVGVMFTDVTIVGYTEAIPHSYDKNGNLVLP